MRIESFATADRLANLRIFCVDCCKRAEIVWCAAADGFQRLIHIRCHGEERLVTFNEYTSRRSAPRFALGQTPNLDMLWGELFDRTDTIAELELFVEEQKRFTTLPKPADCTEELWAAAQAEAMQAAEHGGVVLSWQRANR